VGLGAGHPQSHMAIRPRSEERGIMGFSRKDRAGSSLTPEIADSDLLSEGAHRPLYGSSQRKPLACEVHPGTVIACRGGSVALLLE
jgi:hypothetical protein